MIKVGQEEKHQTQDEDGAHAIERIERGKIECQHLDDRQTGDAQTGYTGRLETPPKPYCNEGSRKHQPPGADRQA